MIEPADIDLVGFLTIWYGPPTRDAKPLPNSCNWLPRPLQEWHVLTSRWDAQITHVTSMIPPEQIEVADDGMATFMVDATGDWHWSFNPEDPNSVFNAELHQPWERNPEQLPEFLVHSTVREVFFGAPARMQAFAVSDENLAQIIDTLEEVAFGAWQLPAQDDRIFMGDNVLVEAIPSPHEPDWYVAAAAPNFSHLSNLEKVAGVDWRKRNV
ncbi:hypothetical protein [Thermomonospora cellulosilytica]|uniref:Uncharacterized protein n=1 Tax=Thermomonospora cellulosilytica TaxID=1411118 RepID=A0A7W3RBA4_9ACTN|nr:hypothetical protein [Thermomonospora cellulosilytica]MBA9007273.1 hypothetical protein [Thermomonospora cellulosilytica]